MKKTSIQRAKCSGFTLTEVMVALSISVMLAAGVLKSQLFFGQTVNKRIQANDNLSQVRYFTQFFGEKIHGSQRSSLLIGNAGNLISFTRYRAGSNLWENATLQYRPASKDLIYTYDGKSKSLLTGTLPADGGTTGAFSLTNSVVRCRLRVGEDEKISVMLNTMAKPRNP